MYYNVHDLYAENPWPFIFITINIQIINKQIKFAKKR